MRRAAYADALGLLPELERRDAREESLDLKVALLAALRRWDEAAAAADGARKPAVAARLRARASLHADPKRVPPGLADDPAVEARIATGWARLNSGDAQGAAREATTVLAQQRHHVGGLALLVAAQQASGDAALPRTRAELGAVWPQGSFVSPSTAAGATGSGSQVQGP